MCEPQIRIGLSKIKRDVMGDITQFIAMPIDLTEDGFVAGEPFKCAVPHRRLSAPKAIGGSWATPAPSPSCAQAIRNSRPPCLEDLAACRTNRRFKQRA